MTRAQIAFLFPGQGSQAVGMGKELAEKYPVVAKLLEYRGVAKSLSSFGENILEFIDPKRFLVLPNTSGARTADEAVRLAREMIIKDNVDFLSGTLTSAVTAFSSGMS